MKDVFTALEMSEKLLKIAFEEEFALHEGLKVVSKIIEKKAKNIIGEYSKGAGPFPEWAPLAERTLMDKERKGYSPPDNPLLRTGDLRNSISSKVDGLEAVVGSTSEIAPYHEFGTSKMPMRPFIGTAAFRSKKKIREILGATAISGFYGKGQKIHESLGYDFTTENE